MDAGVLVASGSYHLKGECDSVIVSDGSHYGIFLDIDKIRTIAHEKEAVAHEWAHWISGATYTFDAPPAVRQKAEVQADRRQIKKLLPFDEMRAAMQNGITEVWELAEFFNVSESLITDAVEFYTGPCGLKF